MSPSYHRSIAVNMKKNEICLILTNFQGIFDGKAGLNIKNGEKWLQCGEYEERKIYLILTNSKVFWRNLGHWIRLNIIHEPNLTLIYDCSAQNNLNYLSSSSQYKNQMTMKQVLSILFSTPPRVILTILEVKQIWYTYTHTT